MNNQKITRHSINCSEYPSSLFSTINQFRLSDLFTDVTIYVDGVPFACHRLILAACSVFKHPTAPIRNELPVLPPPSSIITITNIDSIKNNRLFKIETLNPFQNRWTIQVRVANKTPIRTYSNGDGRLFSCSLVDETSEIRATGFGDDCDRLEPILIVGNVILCFFFL
ncbi:unnamed protein product [Rotaria sp. Silwood1]|nr:unnamed protein product [Rotaria sp. Silwood1]